MKLKRLIYTMAICLMLTACHSSKNGYIGNLTTTGMLDASTEQLYTDLASSYLSWDQIYVPVVFALESPKEMSISGRVTMTYDQDIYISLRFLGAEVGQVYIDKQSIYIVDKFHRYYFTQPIDSILETYGITIADVQNLLLGRAVLPGQGQIKADDSQAFTYLQSDDRWIMTPKHQYDGADWHYIATKTNPPLLSAISLREKGGRVVQCEFSEPSETEAGIAEGVSTITLPYKDTVLQTSITWNLNDAKWNTDRKVKFSVPGNDYKKLDIEALLKSF